MAVKGTEHRLPVLLLLSFIIVVVVVVGKSQELVTKTIKEGKKCDDESRIARIGDHIQVHYVGRIDDENGKEFDSSHKRGKTFDFQLGAGQVIQGYERGIPGMCVGERRILIVPPALAYGSAGIPQIGILPDSYLHFTVDLVKVERGRLKTLSPGLNIPGAKEL